MAVWREVSISGELDAEGDDAVAWYVGEGVVVEECACGSGTRGKSICKLESRMWRWDVLGCGWTYLVGMVG